MQVLTVSSCHLPLSLPAPQKINREDDCKKHKRIVITRIREEQPCLQRYWHELSDDTEESRGRRQDTYIVKQTALSELCSTWSLSQALSKLLLPRRHPQLLPQKCLTLDLLILTRLEGEQQQGNGGKMDTEITFYSVYTYPLGTAGLLHAQVKSWYLQQEQLLSLCYSHSQICKCVDNG